MQSLTILSLDIIRATNDGNDLTPNDLYLCQCAVNGHLSPQGEEYFRTLHAKVMAGEYDASRIWHMGVEHMTKDHEGYIYFKGRQVEHYTYPNAREEKAALIELQKRCLLLEGKGVEVSCTTAVWTVEKHLTQAELKECEAVIG